VTLAADRWPTFVGAPGGPKPSSRRHNVLAVWRWELSKLTGQIRVQAVVGICLIVPFLVVAAFKGQSATPQDTLFGQWVHSSGFATPMVILTFAGQWALPLVTSIVSGDIFSSEDHFGTWKTVLTRSRSRGELFVGKFAAAVTYTVVMLVLLSASSLVAGLVIGTQPLVGLSGQLVPGGHAAALVMASWATQLAPLLGFCAVSVFLSVVTRNSAVGMGGPLLIGLVMQVMTLVNMPAPLRACLLATPFGSWIGLWVQVPFYGPLREGLVTSAAWFVVCTAVAWVCFRRRSIASS
jgi:ABC-2 type transport system permease protein